jgi:magnesium transporter
MNNGNNSSIIAAQLLTQEYFQLYPNEAAQLLNRLPAKEILDLLKAETATISVKVFEALNPDVATEIIPKMDNQFFIEIYKIINVTVGANLLARLDQPIIDEKLSILPKSLAKEFNELMNYPPDTAGSLMDPRVTTFRGDVSVEDALNQIRTYKERRIIDVCLTNDKGFLIANIPLQKIAISQPTMKLSDLVETSPISIHVMAPREDVVKLMEEFKLTSVAVVDFDNLLLGIIRYDALVKAAQQEVSKDVQAMFGAGRDERALSKSGFAIRKRLPWLEINLVTAFLAAAVVGLFEDTIARITALAVFLPVVAGQSGNTGSQALAVTMRGLALREIRLSNWFQIVKKEVFVGMFNGVIIALTTALIAYLWMNNLGLSAVIGIAMILSMVIAGLSGAIIPILLKTVGQDPAQSSSIILTTVTDVVGFLSFLGLAKLMAEILIIS